MHLMLFIAGIFGALAVILGALGSHALVFSPEQMVSWDVALRYMMFHASALLVVALLYDRRPGRWLLISGGLMALGTLCFSGSIIVMLLSGITFLWPVTPLGGVLLMISWLWFIAGAWYHR